MTSTTTTTREVTPRDRFTAHDRELGLDRDLFAAMRGERKPLTAEERSERTAIRQAAYWESFPNGYTPQQQRAAQRLLVAIGDQRDLQDSERLAAIHGVLALLGAER